MIFSAPLLTIKMQSKEAFRKSILDIQQFAAFALKMTTISDYFIPRC
jgi:hypothetical protein